MSFKKRNEAAFIASNPYNVQNQSGKSSATTKSAVSNRRNVQQQIYATYNMAGSNTNGMSALYTFYHKGANKSKHDDHSLPKIVGMNTTNTFGISNTSLDDA